MTREMRGDDLPPRTLRAAEQAAQSDWLRALGRSFVGSKSPAYVQLAWAAAHLPARQEQQAVYWAAEAEGDASLGRWRKWAAMWPNAHLLTAPWNQIDDLMGDDPAARQVAGYITADQIIHLGVLPDTKPFGTLSPEASGRATLAYRQGRHASHLIMGVLRGSGELVVPEGLQILADDQGQQLLVPVANLAADYPGTPLV
jgi:hypothetical protein